MLGPHRADGAAPLAVSDLAASFARFGAPWNGGALVAVSGGPDSTALLGLAAALNDEHGPIFAATVDHGLRAGSDVEAAEVGRFAAHLKVSHAVLRWTGDKPARGVQEAARVARYDLLSAHARALGCSRILLAHTLDDQAETVLMRLARGSGLVGLAGMPSEGRWGGVRLLRPLLVWEKARLIATCRAHGWAFCSDPANADPRFSRARWRKLAPLMAAEGLDARRLSYFAHRVARANAALDAAAAAALAAARRSSPSPGGVDVAVLVAEPDEIVLRALLLLIEAARPSEGTAPLRLQRAERLTENLLAAVRTGVLYRATLAGVIVEHRRGMLHVAAAPPRRQRLAQPSLARSLASPRLPSMTSGAAVLESGSERDLSG